MSIIYSYPEQGALNANDMLIGTSAEKVGGKQKNITRNFTIQQIADFINQGTGLVDPAASDFQIPVFHQQGKKITGSIMSQNTYPSGSAITITGSLTVTSGATIGDSINDIRLQSPTALIGPIKDANNALSAGNQILLSTPSGNVVWQNYEAGLTYEGTWNASTNTPTLTSGQGVSGHFYIVSVAGNTNLDGNNDWHVGDWAVFFDAGGAGTAGWQKIDNTSVLTGSGTANTFAMWTATETLNDSLLSQDAGATKVIVDGLLEIKGDGTSQDGRIKLNCWNNNHGVTIQSPPHSAAQSWTWILPQTVGGANDVLTTDGNTPSQLSWTTPTAPVTGTGTENYVTKWSAGGTGIEDSTIFDNGTNVGIGTTSPSSALYISNTTPEIYLEDSNNTADAKLLANNGNLGLFSDVNNEYNSSIMYFSVDGSEKMRIDSSGNIGIGTTSPDAELTVNGSIGLSYNATNSYQGIKRGNIYTETEFYNITTSDASKPLYNFTNSTGASNLTILQGGNVGIGTSSPDTKLHVEGTSTVVYNPAVVGGQNSASTIRITNDTNAANTFASIDFSTNANRVVNRIVSSHAGTTNRGFLAFVTEHLGIPAERMRITSDGNVGIGTSSPAVSLDVSATDAVQMPVGLTGDRPTGANGMLRYNSTNNGFEGYINGNWGAIGGGSSGGLVFQGTFDASTGAITGGGSLYTCPAGGSGGTVDTAIGDLYIVTTAGSFFCSGTSLNVGDEVICTTAALAGFDNVNNWNAVASGAGGAVTGSGTTNYVPKFTGATVVGNSSIFNDASGNVGIRTTSPSATLHVENSDTVKTAVHISNTSTGGKKWDIASVGSGIIGRVGNLQIRNETDNANYVEITSSGDVGIGTVSPDAKLDVAGSKNSTNLILSAPLNTVGGGNLADYSELLFDNSVVSGNSGQAYIRHLANSHNDSEGAIAFGTTTTGGVTNEALRIIGNGNVGIGTDSPQVSLDLSQNNDAILVPNGPTNDRPSGILPGMIRYNTETSEFEGYSGTLNVSGSWGALGGGGLPTKTVDTFTGSGQSFIDLTVEASSVNYIDMYIDGVYQAKATYTIATPGGTAISRLTLVSGTFPTGVSIETVTTT